MAKVRINFGISDAMREWILSQPGIIGLVEESVTHIVIEHNLTGPQALALKQAFIDKLIEPV